MLVQSIRILFSFFLFQYYSKGSPNFGFRGQIIDILLGTNIFDSL